jgi:hypothetical protein
MIRSDSKFHPPVSDSSISGTGRAREVSEEVIEGVILLNDKNDVLDGAGR